MAENEDETLNTAGKARVVKVDLRAEIMRFAEKLKIQPEDLKKEVVQSQYVLLGDLVRNYYAGRDAGYYEGVRDAIASRWPWWVWLAIGVAVPFVTKFGYKLTIAIAHVYNS